MINRSECSEGKKRARVSRVTSHGSKITRLIRMCPKNGEAGKQDHNFRHQVVNHWRVNGEIMAREGERSKVQFEFESV